MPRKYIPSVVQVVAVAMLLSMFFVVETRSLLSGGISADYCTLNPDNCNSAKRQLLRKVCLVAYSLFSYFTDSFVKISHRPF